MTAQASTTGAPPWARKVWYDAEAIYLEFPTKEAAPFIMKFSWSDAGLQKALYTMKRLWQDCDIQARETYRKPDGGYTVKRTRKPLPGSQVTKAQATAIQDILRKGGYIK